MGADTIQEMAIKGLVNGMNIRREHEMLGKCEDCIYGKHSTHPFNNESVKEETVLECVHMDIWGPTRVKSAGGALYFMLIMDGYSSFQTIAFLSTKSADTTLNVFKAYHVEAERQTGMKLKRVRMDMEREWNNEAWEAYHREHGLVFEFIAPYAHQQNGVAEQSMQTLLNTARTTIAEVGLPLKYWVDTV